MLCTSKSEAAVTGNKNRAVGMLKLTTDKHEASRGLSATAELLVIIFATYFPHTVMSLDVLRVKETVPCDNRLRLMKYFELEHS